MYQDIIVRTLFYYNIPYYVITVIIHVCMYVYVYVYIYIYIHIMPLSLYMYIYIYIYIITSAPAELRDAPMRDGGDLHYLNSNNSVIIITTIH